MAGAFFTITPSGYEPVLEQLQLYYEKTGDLSPVLADIGEMFLISHQKRWQVEQAPDGTPWQPLSEETIERKGHDLILREHDYLRDMLNYQVDPLALYFGTPIGYGEYHQLGLGVPERVWLGVSPTDLQQVLDLVGAYLEGAES
ncbi:phage virion morphogenesis protein [Aeromonas veronii]|uniref:phage virion morphogenesis protein n=1 Tax=Aeromonas veronii TaxID=654 RepID=UPI003F794F3D